MKNPHNWLVALDPPRETPPRRWRCHYCRIEGLYDEVVAVACTHVYPPCNACGQTPICSLTCAGIAAALSDSGVHIAGSTDPDLPEA